MTEFVLRIILKDWIAEVGTTITERANANTVLRANLAGGEASYDVYDNAMTFTEKRLGILLPTISGMFSASVAPSGSPDVMDILFELGAKSWLCGRLLAREAGNFDVDDKKLSQVLQNVKILKAEIDTEFNEIRREIWGNGLRNRRTTSGDLTITHISVVSGTQTDIDNGDLLEL